MVTNYYGGVTGGLGFGKGAVDTLEAVMCQDGICAAVSVIGCVADGVQMIGAIVPGPNVTMVITAPISWGCKSFVWCCKKSKLPWRMC
jgi:hypothetical protein